MDNYLVPYYVTEMYINKRGRLSQSIMYKYGDDRERDYLRSTINPLLETLRDQSIYDRSHKKIYYDEKEGKWKLWNTQKK